MPDLESSLIIVGAVESENNIVISSNVNWLIISLRYPELNPISKLGPLYFIFISSIPLPPSCKLFADIVILFLFKFNLIAFDFSVVIVDIFLIVSKYFFLLIVKVLLAFVGITFS